VTAPTPGREAAVLALLGLLLALWAGLLVLLPLGPAVGLGRGPFVP
jgi:hypothetical protein